MVKFREVRLTDAISFLTLMCSFVLMVEISLANVSNFNQNFNYQNEVYIKVYENHNPIPKYINQQETIKCFKREYVFQAVQIDTFGRKCWDYIKVMTCWGRCDSGEVTDWRFPYKKSFDSVCTHQTYENKTIEFKHCDEGVELSLKIFKYVDAVTCICKLCPSSSTNCEGMSYYGGKFYDLFFSSKSFNLTS